MGLWSPKEGGGGSVPDRQPQQKEERVMSLYVPLSGKALNETLTSKGKVDSGVCVETKTEEARVKIMAVLEKEDVGYFEPFNKKT